jgi:uncharacterized protein
MQLASDPRMKTFVAMRQRWESMLLLHWRVTPSVIERHLPDEVRVDTFDGSAWLSLVPFVSRRMRPALMPKTFGMDYVEANLRTYVVYRGEPAIWLFSADVDSMVAAAGYRPLLGRASRRAIMSLTDLNGNVTLRATRGRAALTVNAVVEDLASPEDALDHFVLERYLLVGVRARTLWGHRVRHASLKPLACTAEIDDQMWTDAMGLPPIEPMPERGHYVGGIDVDLEAPHLLGSAHLTQEAPLTP